MLADVASLPTSLFLSPSESGLSSLWKRALDDAAEGISISDLSQPDNPIIYVNGGFERMTGYRSEEVTGRNCRFLQGPETDRNAVAALRQAIQEQREHTVELLNYRKNGEPFWNRLSLRPVRDSAGAVTHFIGIQSDVTRRRRAEGDLRRAKQELESAYRGLRDSLDAAARIQQSLLPTRPLKIDGFQVEWVFEPCEELAGDSLNVMPLDDRHLAVYMLDVSGHGLPAALLSVTLSRVLSPLSPESILYTTRGGRSRRRISAPSEVLSRLNRQFPFDPTTSQYFTIFYGIIDRRTGSLRYASSGHPPASVVSATGEVRLLEASGFPIGIVAEPGYEDRVARLDLGDRLVVHTDGVTEAADSAGEEFGHERLGALLAATRNQPLAGSLATVITGVEDWHGGSSFPDDLSLLAIEVEPTRSGKAWRR